MSLDQIYVSHLESSPFYLNNLFFVDSYNTITLIRFMYNQTFYFYLYFVKQGTLL